MKIFKTLMSYTFLILSLNRLIIYVVVIFFMNNIAFILNENVENSKDVFIYIMGGTEGQSGLINLLFMLFFLIVILNSVNKYLELNLNHQKYLMAHRLGSRMKYFKQVLLQSACLIMILITIFYLVFITNACLFNKVINIETIVYLIQSFVLIYVGLLTYVSLSFALLVLFGEVYVSLTVVFFFIVVNFFKYIFVGGFMPIDKLMSFSFVDIFTYIIVNLLIIILNIVAVVLSGKEALYVKYHQIRKKFW